MSEATYRVEVSVSARAGCQATHCKKEGAKIQKGELRHGVLVSIQEYTSWKWRHWGCVTPTVIHNWIDKAGAENGDMDLVDGYEELPDELQEKVRRCFEQGHVDDEDWNGDAELNRYNPDKKQQGMFHKSRKAKNEDEIDAKPKPKKASKKRGRQDIDEDEEAEVEREAPAKKRRSRKATKTENDDIDGQQEHHVPSQKARTKKGVMAQPKEEDDAVVAVSAPPAKKVRSKNSIKPEQVEDEETLPAQKNKSKKAVKAEPVEHEDVAEAAAAASKKGRTRTNPRAKKLKSEAEADKDDEELVSETTKHIKDIGSRAPPTTGRGRKRASAAAATSSSDPIFADTPTTATERKANAKPIATLDEVVDNADAPTKKARKGRAKKAT